MEKIKCYTYLGNNGTITSTVFLEGIYSVVKYQLIAGKDKLLTKDGINTVSSTIIPENEVSQWYEVDKK